VLHPVGLIRPCNVVGKTLDRLSNPGRRKDAPDRVVLLASVVLGRFSRKFAAPGAFGVVANTNGVSPTWAWAFGSAPFSTRSLTKSRLVTLPQEHALFNGVLPCGLDTASRHDELILMGLVASFRQIGQSVERNAGAVSRGHGHPRAQVSNLIDSHHSTKEEAENLFEALTRLVGPKEMGARYKVLAIARKKAGICFTYARLARACIPRQPV
jgi:hypothetical protein